jgi:peptidoglycan hydrolase CwlO-like protein
MSKLLSIIALIATLGAAIMAYTKIGQFNQVRKEKQDLDNKSEKALAVCDSKSTECANLDIKFNALTESISIAEQKISTLKRSISQTTNEITDAQKELESKNLVLAELKTQLAKLPPGINPETLGEDLNKLKKVNAELEGAIEETGKLVVAENDKLPGLKKNLADINEKIEARRRLFDKNALDTQVVAVNPDWGFVIVNAGQNKDINAASRLIVTRDSVVIGKLNVISVHGNQALANINYEVDYSGRQVAPGDKVILENIFQ